MGRLRLVVALLGIPGLAAAQPPAYEQPPPPMQPQPPAQILPTPGAPARATFMSTTQQQWNVWVDQQLMCTTPCTLGLTTAQFVALKTQDDEPIRLDVGNIPPGDVTVRGKPLQTRLYATGITFTALSSMALATGITLTAVGWGTGHDGMRTAGLITGVAGGVGLYGSIYLMRTALPEVTLGPATPYATANQVGLAGRF